jgi:hypothetical protein
MILATPPAEPCASLSVMLFGICRSSSHRAMGVMLQGVSCSWLLLSTQVSNRTVLQVSTWYRPAFVLMVAWYCVCGSRTVAGPTTIASITPATDSQQKHHAVVVPNCHSACVRCQCELCTASGYKTWITEVDFRRGMPGLWM